MKKISKVMMWIFIVIFVFSILISWKVSQIKMSEAEKDKKSAEKNKKIDKAKKTKLIKDAEKKYKMYNKIHVYSYNLLVILIVIILMIIAIVLFPKLNLYPIY